jgi:hypothetical protein
MTKEGRTRWAGHAAGLREISHTELRSGKALIDLGVGGRILLKMYLKNRIHLAQDRGQCWALVNTAMNQRVSHVVANVFTTSATISFPRRTPLHQVNYN